MKEKSNFKIVLVSIIMPVFNGEKTILKAIRSANRQTVAKEIIVIDDCSTDNTLKELKKIDINIKLIKNKENIGPGPSRNIGIKYAKGDYLFFLDADDILPDSNSLKKMADFCENNGLLICGSLRENKYKYLVKKENMYRDEIKRNRNGIILNYLDTQVDYHFTNYIFNRGLIVNNCISFPTLRRYQDVPFLVNTMLLAKEYGVVDVVGYRYKIKQTPLIFDDKMLLDLLLGLSMVLDIANQYDLNKLKTKTIDRIKHQYSPQIRQAFDSSDVSIHNQLVHLFSISIYG